MPTLRELRTEIIPAAGIVTTTTSLIASARANRAYFVVQCDFATGVPVNIGWRGLRGNNANNVVLQPGEIMILNGRDEDGNINGDMPWFGEIDAVGVGGTAVVRGGDTWWAD